MPDTKEQLLLLHTDDLVHLDGLGSRLQALDDFAFALKLLLIDRRIVSLDQSIAYIGKNFAFTLNLVPLDDVTEAEEVPFRFE